MLFYWSNISSLYSSLTRKLKYLYSVFFKLIHNSENRSEIEGWSIHGSHGDQTSFPISLGHEKCFFNLLFRSIKPSLTSHENQDKYAESQAKQILF